MRMERDTRGQGPLIAGIVGRGFRVDDGVYEGLAITPRRADGWAPPPLTELTEAELAPVLAIDPLPEFIILGTGKRLMRPPRALVAAMEGRGIGIEPMDSRAAAREWGVLRAELRWVAAALYPLD
jgi:uncharacterized protein